jgi:hypothetical protein
MIIPASPISSNLESGVVSSEELIDSGETPAAVALWMVESRVAGEQSLHQKEVTFESFGYQEQPDPGVVAFVDAVDSCNSSSISEKSSGHADRGPVYAMSKPPAAGVHSFPATQNHVLRFSSRRAATIVTTGCNPEQDLEAPSGESTGGKEHGSSNMNGRGKISANGYGERNRGFDGGGVPRSNSMPKACSAYETRSKHDDMEEGINSSCIQVDYYRVASGGAAAAADSSNCVHDDCGGVGDRMSQ